MLGIEVRDATTNAVDGVYGVVRMHRGGTESTENSMLVEEELTGKNLGAAIEVYSTLGPGLLNFNVVVLKRGIIRRVL
jgi:hypothetical protein